MTEAKERVSSGITVNVEKVEGRVGTAVLHCAGYLDTYNSADFATQGKAAIEGGARNLIFDMENVNYVSSTGVGTFVAFLKAVKPLGGNIVIAAMQPRVFEVVRLLGFSKFFNVADNVGEALEFFPQESARKAIPFRAMESITDTVGRLEGFVTKDNHPAFYAEVVGLLKSIEDLKKA